MHGEFHVPGLPSAGGPASVDGAVHTQHVSIAGDPMVHASPEWLQLWPVPTGPGVDEHADVASAADASARERAKRR
jgi:hypothetical protein